MQFRVLKKTEVYRDGKEYTSCYPQMKWYGVWWYIKRNYGHYELRFFRNGIITDPYYGSLDDALKFIDEYIKYNERLHNRTVITTRTEIEDVK